MKLGILASILLLSAALVAPMSISFAQTSGSDSTGTNSTDTTTSTTAETKAETKTETPSSPPPKPLSDEERIQKIIAQEKEKLAKRFDEKSKMIKEQALKKSKATNDIIQERLKRLEEKKVN